MVHKNQHEQLAWDMYFANLCAMQYHPANAHNYDPDILAKCAQLADNMIIERRTRCPHG